MQDMLNLTNIDIKVDPMIYCHKVYKKGSWKYVQENRKNNVFIFIEKGECDYLLNGKEYNLRKGDMIFLLEGDNYIGRSTTDDDSYECVFHVVSFDILSGDLLYISRKHTIKHYEKMLQLFIDMAVCMEKMKFGYKINGQKIMYDILYNLYKEMFYYEISNETQLNIENARNYIDQNYNQKITINELADISGYCRSYFKKMFKKQYSLSPNDYLHTVRIEKAKAMLESKLYSISEIAEKTGYSSESYFSQVFKKKVGCAPTNY